MMYLDCLTEKSEIVNDRVFNTYDPDYDYERFQNSSTGYYIQDRPLEDLDENLVEITIIKRFR